MLKHVFKIKNYNSIYDATMNVPRHTNISRTTVAARPLQTNGLCSSHVG